MSEVEFKIRIAATMTSGAGKAYRPVLPVVAAVTMVLLAGCALQKRDSITVGAVPDDYRTNHPIVIADKQLTLDLPVAASDRGATRPQKESLEGFLSGYDRTAAPVLNIIAPSGSANGVAAADAAHDFASIAKASGVPSNRIVMAFYQAGPEENSAPVRISFLAMRAQTNKCGRWPGDVLDTSENKHYANFGCSSQNNLAAQVANPEDLLGPRKQTPIDADNRDAVIGDYRDAPAGFEPTIDY